LLIAVGRFPTILVSKEAVFSIHVLSQQCASVSCRIKEGFIVKVVTQLCSGSPHSTVLIDPCSNNTWALCQHNYLILEEILQGCPGVLLV